MDADAFNAWWKLDTGRSDSIEKYLTCMGLNPMAVEAALKGERDFPTLHHIELRPTGYKIERRSRMGDKISDFTFGQVATADTRQGTRETRTSFDKEACVLETITTLPILSQQKIKIVDRRWIMKETLLSGLDGTKCTHSCMHQNCRDQPIQKRR